MHVLPSLEVGGMEKVVVNLSNGLDRQRYQVAICCIERGGALQRELSPPGLPVYVMNKPEGVDYFLPFRLSRLFNRLNVDIVHTHSMGVFPYGCLAATFSRTPVYVHSEHGSFNLKTVRRRLAFQYGMRRTDRVLTVSETVKHQLLGVIDIPEKKITPIMNGVDTRRCAPDDAASAALRAALDIPDGAPVIGAIGRLVTAKNYPTLLHVVAQLTRRHPQLVCLMVGDGPERARLHAQADALKLSGHVRWLGERHDVAELLNLMQVYLLPSYSEGMSIALLEAMVAGRPIVVSDITANREVIRHGQTGWLVPPADIEQWAGAVARLLTDRVMAQQLGRAAQATAQQFFSIPRMCRSFEALYEQLLEEKRGRVDPRGYRNQAVSVAR
ncbi:MAG: glycosyltransferase [Nitrospirota bacterium]